MYDIFFLITMPIHILAIYKLNLCFLGEYKTLNRNAELKIYFIYGILLSVVYYFTRLPLAFLIFNCISLFLISSNYDSNLFERVVNIFIIYSVMIIIEVTVSALTGYVNIEALEKSSYDSIIGIIIARILIFVLASLLYKYKKSRNNNLNIPVYYYLCHIFVLVGTLYIYLISLDNVTSSFKIIIISTIVLFINILILFINDKIYDNMKISYEKDILKQQNEYYKNQFEIIEQSSAIVNELKHDMKNHLISLKSLYLKGEETLFDEYVGNIILYLDGDKNLAKSDNFLVNSIINFKLQELLNEEIKIKLNIEIPKNLKILAYDLTAILGNLLDNAISGIKNCSSTKKLNLIMTMSKGSLIIMLDNSYSGTLNIKDGNFISTKNISEKSGLGIQNIKRVVQKYYGEIEINYTQEIFSVEILIPNVE